MFRFKPEIPRERSIENFRKIRTALEALVGPIESLLNMEVGLNFKDSERAMDWVLTAHFESEEALAIYQKHPLHLSVVSLINEYCFDAKVVDYHL